MSAVKGTTSDPRTESAYAAEFVRVYFRSKHIIDPVALKAVEDLVVALDAGHHLPVGFRRAAAVPAEARPEAPTASLATPDSEPRVPSAVPLCPLCGGKMAKRTSQFGTFWGCAAYPSCKGKRDYNHG